MNQLSNSDKLLGGLVVRKSCWTLSIRGKLLTLALTGGLIFGALRGIHPFLAVTDAVPADVLIIEGWIPPSTMREAATEFQRGGYHHLVLLRPIVDVADKYQSGRYTGDYMANLLQEAGARPARPGIAIGQGWRKRRRPRSSDHTVAWRPPAGGCELSLRFRYGRREGW